LGIWQRATMLSVIRRQIETTKVLKFEDLRESWRHYVLTKQIVHSYENGDRITTEFNF